tara:strand:- start:2417 stop:2812 length:396 start_codon:yes stop_codon:yes gene_type:complete
MDISLYNASLLTIIGIITGTSLGLTGLGSILTVPLLIYAGMTPHETVATVLALHVFPQALPGLYLYYKKGHLRLIKSLFVIIGSAIGIYIGSFINCENLISEYTLYTFISIILALSSVYIYFKYVLKYDFL